MAAACVLAAPAAPGYGEDGGVGHTISYDCTIDPVTVTVRCTSVSGNESYTVNNANMLLTRGSNSYTNDLDGNTLSGAGRTNSWDSENRLTERVYNGNTCQYVYGADGLRRRSTVNSVATDYVLDGTMSVRDLQAGSSIATYLVDPRGPEYRRDDTTGNVRWYVEDGLGSVIDEVDPSGRVTANRKYDVFGSVRAQTGATTSKHEFVGALGHPSEAETGLVTVRRRWAAPVAGRRPPGGRSGVGQARRAGGGGARRRAHRGGRAELLLRSGGRRRTRR